MGYFTTIYIVTVENKDQTLQKRMWFWDDTEGHDMYQSAVDEVGDISIVTLYSIDVQDRINAEVDSLMANRHSAATPTPLQEIRSNRQASEAEDVTWSDLEYRAEGYFYMERLKESSSEHWAFHVEPYGTQTAGQQWRVMDASETPLAIVRAKGSEFVVTVNGYSQTKRFGNLKAATIYAVGEFNG